MSFSYRRIWLIGCGFLALQLAFTVYNTFLPVFYREFLGSSTAIGLLMGTDNLIGLLLIPVVGAWSDRVDSPLGRRLPFLILAIPVAALTLVAIPYAAVMLWSLVLAEVAFTAAMHAYRGPIAAMVVDHTPPERRATSSGIAQLLGGLGALLALGVVSRLFDIDPRLPFGVAGALLLASLGIVWLSAERRPRHIDHSPVATSSPLVDLRDGVRTLLRPDRRGQRLILASLLAAYVGFAGLEAMFPIYGIDALGITPGRSALLLTNFAGAFLVAAFPAGMIGTRFGKLPVMLVALGSLAMLYLGAVWLTDPTAIARVLLLSGVAWALFAIPAVALIADLGGRDRVAFYLALYYVFLMSGRMVGPAVVGAAMDLVGPRGIWIAASTVTLAAFGLLFTGRRGLGREPEQLAGATTLAHRVLAPGTSGSVVAGIEPGGGDQTT